MAKKLYRPENDRKIAGVCSGIAKYLGLDPTLVRLGAAVLTCFWLTGIILYIVAAIIIPSESEIRQ